MADSKSSLARDGTMQVTAKEGIDYLKSAHKDTLLKAQGLVKDAKPAVQRDGTMVSTAKEAECLLEGNKPDSDAQTRGQQKQIEELKNEKAEPKAKKARLSKDTTMAATAKEAKSLLAGEKLGDTRQETKNKPKTPLRKNTTMARTVEEAKTVLDGNLDTSEGRKTRSQSRGDAPKPSVKKLGTMQQTAKDGKAFLNRGKGKKAAKAVEEDKEES